MTQVDGKTRADDPGEPSTGLPRVSITDAEAHLLAFLARDKHVFELGTGLGVSATAMNTWALSVTTVDIDPWVHKEIFPFLHDEFGIKCLTYLEAFPSEPVYDMVFIDATHTDEALTADLELAASLCVRGMIVVHDAYDMRETLEREGGFHIIETRYGLGIKYVGWT